MGVESRRSRKGGKEGREKDVGKGVGWRMRDSATKAGSEKEREKGREEGREKEKDGRRSEQRGERRW